VSAGPVAVEKPDTDPQAPPRGPDDRGTVTRAGRGSRVTAAALRAWTLFTRTALAPHQAAVARMGFALVFCGYLLREWPHRQALYGPGSPLSPALAQDLVARQHSFTMLVWSSSQWWFEALYVAAIAVSVLFFLGWRTRAMSVLFMLMVLSIEHRNMLVADGGDNVVRLMALYLVLTRCGAVWSLDARRRRREAASREASRPSRWPSDVAGPVLWASLGALLLAAQLSGLSGDMLAADGWGAVLWAFWACAGLAYAAERLLPSRDLRTVVDAAGTMLHNCAMAVIVVEICLVYAVAGWYKTQGPLWADGTAVYYPLHVDYYTPWPTLSHALSAEPHVVFLITYGTMLVQLAFPFLVFNPRCRKALLGLLMVEHFFMGVVLGIPFFSLAMLAADAVFLPTDVLRRVAGAVEGKVTSWGRRGADDGAPPRGAVPR
jgi:hypothetical protein